MLARLGNHWYFKALGTTVFMLLFFWVYLSLLRYPLFPVTVMPLMELDSWIAFQPGFLPLYVSLWVYVSLPAAFLETRKELLTYGWYITLVCLIGLLIFLFWPTVIPASKIDWAHFPGVSHLKALDAAGNAFPSLHVATAFFSALWLDRQLSEMGGRRGLRMVNALWCLGIVYSTLAIKQHVVWDVLAGLLLGGVLAVLSLRHLKLTDTGWKKCSMNIHPVMDTKSIEQS